MDSKSEYCGSRSINWSDIRDAYPAQQPLMNLNNAAVSPPPISVEHAVIEAYRFISHNPDFNMWSCLDSTLPDVKRELAKLVDCEDSQIALNRNASEGISVAIFGIPMKPGERVLLSPWDYPSALAGWQQRGEREGICVDSVAFDPMDCDDAIVAAYLRSIRDETKVIHLTHMLHWTGRVLPVEKICALASQRGIVTIVDAAQSFAQMPISVRAMRCDYFVTSLHKWLGAPVGNGMLVVSKKQMEATWPLLAPFDLSAKQADKFDHWNLGTYNSALQAGILPAIQLHQLIGTQNIKQRLSTLTRYWIERASDIRGLNLHTPLDNDTLGAVSLFSIEGRDSLEIERTLREQHRIHTKYRKVGTLEGVRVSPHLYMTEDDLDTFVDALRRVVT